MGKKINKMVHKNCSKTTLSALKTNNKGTLDTQKRVEIEDILHHGVGDSREYLVSWKLTLITAGFLLVILTP